MRRPSVTVFECGEKRPRCSSCGKRSAAVRCGYVLRGSLTGHACDRPLCARCATKAGGVDLCPVHSRAAT